MTAAKVMGLSVSFLFVLVAQASADPEEVVLMVDQTLHKAGTPGTVTFTLKNLSSKIWLLPSSNPWKVTSDDNTPVYTPFSAQALVALEPGQFFSWSWNKRNQASVLVGSGNFLLQVGPITSADGEETDTLKCWLALTPTGKLIGTNAFFPLSDGNHWVFQSKDSLEFEAISIIGKSGSWYKMHNFPGLGNLSGLWTWTRLTSTSKPTWYVAGPWQKYTKVLIPFKRPVGSTFKINLGTLKKLKVAALNETVVTPIGTFKSCYRLDSVPVGAGTPAIQSLWFAPNIGLVQFTTPSKTYRLHRAMIKSALGATYYRIGIQ